MMDPTMAETFEAWTTGAVAILTGIAILIGGGWVLWRYVIPGPFAPNWELKVRDCAVRRLPSGNYKYTVDVDVENRSKTVCVVERAAINIFFPKGTSPDDDEPSNEAREKALKDAEIKPNLRCAPRTSRTLHGFVTGDEILHQVVFVAWRICYRRPRWLGVAGRRVETEENERFVSVDPQSLALCMKSSKEESNT